MSTAESQYAEFRSRSEKNRLRWVAALSLGTVMTGHMLLETAGDALFLANIAVERLPFATIVVAVLAAAVSLGTTSRGHRSALIGLQAMAAIGTIGLWSLLAASQAWTYYALYVWSGIITSLIILRFWLLLGDLFTIREGKRLYATIAIGGSVGALVGASVATYLAPRTGGAGLLVASAGAFALSTLGPCFLLGRQTTDESAPTSADLTAATGLAESLRGIRNSAYARRIAGLVMLGGITLTLGDYLFKSVLAEEIAPDQLATWLSRIYLGLNLLSIMILTLGVTRLLRWLGVDRSLAVLPALIACGALGVLVGGALVACVFLKTADGTLRYSLHRTASELLYLPMSARLRSSVKGAIDIVGQTAAKAFASVLILGLAMWPESRSFVAAAVVIAASTWFVSALRLRHSYLDVFRKTLSEGLIETSIDHPELDLQSAASLIGALSDADERRVIAAMRILVERGHCSLISSLILYHPAPRVVTHALDMFAEERREDLLGLLKHLIDHEDPAVRAATVRATWVLDPDLSHLQAFRDSECLAIQVSAMAGLLAVGAVEPEGYEAILDEAIRYETPEPRRAAATAARLRYHPVAREALLRFTQDEDTETAQEAVRAIRSSGDEWFTAPLVGLLGNRRTRDGVRDALIDRGDSALRVLADQLIDPATPVPILRHIPRTIARFESPKAAKVLIDSLSRIENGMVRFKLLRGLETLLLPHGKERGAETKLDDLIDIQGIRDEFDRTLERSVDLLHLEAVLARSKEEDPELATVGGELLVELLQDKRQLAMGRIFRLLGLIHRNEDFRAIQAGLRNSSGTERASAEELIETLLSRDAGRAVLGLTTAGDVEAKLALTDSKRSDRPIDTTAAVRALL
ncbi:MAG: Npt1/Npt2 family nucleotide transporter, partial [Myxococcota bacterium]